MKKSRIFRDYISEKKGFLIIFCICVIIFAFIFYLYYLELEAIFYASLLCLIMICIVTCLDFYQYLQKRLELHHMKKTIQYSLENVIASTPVEQDYHDLIALLIEDIRLIQKENDIAKQDMLDYYTLWAHQIKLPISAMNLLLQSDPSPLHFQLSAELIKIEQYVDMVMSYLRLSSQSTDYMIQEYNLDDIIRQAIRKLSVLFIEKHIQIDFQETHQRVLTDAKWLQYVIEQLLSNAVKYTKQGKVSLYGKDQKFIIQDTGIGIEESDLNRIFEKGFTGYNGRSGEQSSGLGLYLCDKILRNLSHRIEIKSVVNQGTKVILDLSYENIDIE